MGTGKMGIRELILKSKPINLYGYTIIGFVLLFSVGLAYAWLLKDIRPEVMLVVTLTLIVPIMSYLFRFYWSRNNPGLRKEIESTESDNDAFNLIMGGLQIRHFDAHFYDDCFLCITKDTCSMNPCKRMQTDQQTATRFADR